VTSVAFTAPTGFTITGSPITSSGIIALSFASGYSLPTTASQANWTTAYNDSIVSASVSGTTTKTLTLNQQDGGTVTASWSDIDTGLTSVGLSMPSAFAVSNSPLTSNGTIAVTGAGTSAQYVRGDGSLATFPSLTGFVPYTGATTNVDLGTHRILAQNATIASNGSGDTFTLNHTSGSGIGLNITKGGSGEGLYINKTSGSGNAATIIGTLNATTLVKSGGTSTQFLKADGSVDSTTYIPTTRTLTINDVSYDLTANRSWDVGDYGTW
jgi:hypothetical protein